MKLDLHTHTTYSDGELTPLENAFRAKKLGLDGIAITDHDNIDSWLDIDQEEMPIPVWKGIEVSSYHKDASVHVLGYYLGEGEYQELSNYVRQTAYERVERMKKIQSLLEKLGIELTTDEIIQESHGIVARPHIAQAILKKYPERGYTKDSIFDDFLGDNAPAYVPVNRFATEDAVQLLHRNHCLAVIAHPLIIRKFDFRELKDLGIDGYEGVYHYKHSNPEEVIRFAEENGLLVTGGSDFHNPNGRDSMGKVYIDGERSKTFVKRFPC